VSVFHETSALPLPRRWVTVHGQEWRNQFRNAVSQTIMLDLDRFSAVSSPETPVFTGFLARERLRRWQSGDPASRRPPRPAALLRAASRETPHTGPNIPPHQPVARHDKNRGSAVLCIGGNRSRARMAKPVQKRRFPDNHARFGPVLCGIESRDARIYRVSGP
jgi:hypothetical protein